MSRRGKRGPSLGKKNYPADSFYVEFDEFGAATGNTAGRFNTWFSKEVKTYIPYHLEWKRIKKEKKEQMKEDIWLLTMETWIMLDDYGKAKKTQLSKVNSLHRSLRNTLVTEFVRKNLEPFESYEYLDRDPDNWRKFVAYTTSRKFMENSKKAKQSALSNNDPARVGRSGYAALRALWKAKRKELIEKIPLLGLLQSERSILHVLGRMQKNKETGLKELTDFVRERLNELIKKEKEMKADGTYVMGNDPLTGVVGPEHGGRTRSVSSTVGSMEALGSRKRKRMQKIPHKLSEDMKGQIRNNVMAHVMPEIEQLRADIETLRKLFGGVSSGVAGHVTVDRFDEIEECELMHIHYGTEVKVGKGVIFPLHRVPMEPGYMKIQVGTVYPGWEGLPVPKPTDEVKLLGDATKDARYIQWPKDYLKVPALMSSSFESTSHPSSSSPLYSIVEEQFPLPSESTTSQGGPKKFPTDLPQKEPSTTMKCLKVLAKRPLNIRKIANKFIKFPKQGDHILVQALDGLYEAPYYDRIFYDSVLGWMTNDWLDGAILHWCGMQLHWLVQQRFRGYNKCGILNPALTDFRYCRRDNGASVLKYIESTLRLQQDKTIFIAPYLQSGHWVLFVICPLTKTGYILDSLNKDLKKDPSMYSLTPLVEKACHDMSASEWNWSMVKCCQQESAWECGYYVGIAMSELFCKLQTNFPHNVWDNMRSRTQQEIDQWVESSVSQFYSIHFADD